MNTNTQTFQFQATAHSSAALQILGYVIPCLMIFAAVFLAVIVWKNRSK